MIAPFASSKPLKPARPKQSAAPSPRLSDYSWPPNKPNFTYRKIAFEKGRWVVGFRFRGNPVSLFLDPAEQLGKFKPVRPGGPGSFEKVAGGWLGRIPVQNHRTGGFALLLIHLGGGGNASVGLWDVYNQKFIPIDREKFFEKPEFLHASGKEARMTRPEDLPGPLSEHGKNLSYFRVIGMPLQLGWPALHFGVDSGEADSSWKIERGGGAKPTSLRLPIDNRETAAPAVNDKDDKGIFSKWERTPGKWTSTEHVPIGEEGLGVVREAKLKLSLHDNGVSVLTLEEERQSGEKTAYRLDPSWLSNPTCKPRILAVRKLAPQQSFDDADFNEDALSERSGSPELQFHPVIPEIEGTKLGGVIV